MKFLLDVCSSLRSLTAFLIEQGHDVASALSLKPQASDAEPLTLAHRERRALRRGTLSYATANSE